MVDCTAQKEAAQSFKGRRQGRRTSHASKNQKQTGRGKLNKYHKSFTNADRTEERGQLSSSPTEAETLKRKLQRRRGSAGAWTTEFQTRRGRQHVAAVEAEQSGWQPLALCHGGHIATACGHHDAAPRAATDGKLRCAANHECGQAPPAQH